MTSDFKDQSAFMRSIVQQNFDDLVEFVSEQMAQKNLLRDAGSAEAKQVTVALVAQIASEVTAQTAAETAAEAVALSGAMGARQPE